ncbi:RNA polymerase sigma factor [Membranihabitans maritimus]|uniref:RNA polymerase sigma factor n=1 Tax=Membranihabitans maritimus TaxID=2904244 RepID=UPI001F289D04|nr:RNA polymerase sigma factor [Membranihabitans maritimus]
MDELKVIKGLKKGKRKFQKEVYNQYAPVFMAIGIRYLKSKHEAEDTVAEAFFKIFTKIKTYKNNGSFEGWMKRIMINECLMVLRKKQRSFLHIPLDNVEIEIPSDAVSQLGEDELLEMIAELPEGYRTIFNLYVVEGYKHREIADMLDISIHTSKSQLLMAKRKLQEELKKNRIRSLNNKLIQNG